MAATHRELVRNAEVLGRLAAFVESQQRSSLPLTEGLSTMGASPGRWIRIVVDHDGREISAACAWPEDDALLREWAAGHGWAPLLARAAIAQPEGRVVELTLGEDSLSLTAHLPRRRDMDELRGVLAGSGLDDATAARLVESVQFLAAGQAGPAMCDGVSLASDGGVTVRVVRRLETPDEEIEAMGRIVTTAEELGVTEAQRGLFERTFPILARGKKRCLISLDAAPGGIHPRIRVEQRDVPFEHVLRLFVGLYSLTGVADRLGSFAGAFKAERAASFELCFTTTEPPPARVGVELSAR